MWNWLKSKLFYEEPQPKLVIADMTRIALERERRAQQIVFMNELGFAEGDDSHNWLRLHQLLKDHEDRLKALEGRE